MQTRVKSFQSEFRLIGVSIFYGFILAGCGQEHHDDLKTGKQLFNQYCTECHNKTGNGNFLWAVPASRNTQLSSSEIYHKIKQGDDTGISNMPLFSGMNAGEAAKIVAYIKRM